MSKVSESLAILEQIEMLGETQLGGITSYGTIKERFTKECNDIELALEVLEIIVEKRVCFDILRSSIDVEIYNREIEFYLGSDYDICELTETEFNKIKEFLKGRE